MLLKQYQIKKILEIYPDTKAADIAKRLNISVRHVYSTAKRYGVKKSEAFLNSPSSGRIQKGNCLSPETQFKKGHVGNTKGMRMEALLKSAEKIQAWKKNHWKKGNKPFNTAKDGDLRFRKNPGYWFIRLSENNWEFYHRWLWKQKYGEITEGYNVIFKDNFDKRLIPEISDIECISNAELIERNRHSKYPLEVMQAIELKNKLNKLIKVKQNENEQNEQRINVG